MILDEAIRRYTNNAEYEQAHGNLQGCLDFGQLAEWLKELKQLKEQMSDSEKPNKWIPATTLPEKDGEYLLFGKIDETEENHIFIGEYDSGSEDFGIWEEQFDSSTLGCLGSEFYEYASVLAWMPLPTSYQGRK